MFFTLLLFPFCTHLKIPGRDITYFAKTTHPYWTTERCGEAGLMDRSETPLLTHKNTRCAVRHPFLFLQFARRLTSD